LEEHADLITTLPNLLTLSRIAVIPVIVALFFVDGAVARWVSCALFTLAAVTDYLDGHIARSRQEVSNLGRFLDPLADKLLVVTVIVMLVAFDRMSLLTVLPAVVIVSREIIVSGLREFLAALDVGLPVTTLSKWKTGIQMVALGFLIVGDDGPAFIPVQIIGELGLWLAGMMTVITGYDYLRASAPHLVDRGKRKSGTERSDAAKSAGATR
jgi:cardiolipin synthase